MAQTASGKPLGAFARAFATMRSRLYSTVGGLTVEGVDVSAFPSPMIPVQPIGPEGSKPLAFSYWQGINQSITPRLDAPLSFAELRELGSYPLAWICRENVKDVLCTMKWKIQLKRIHGESTADWKKRQANDKVGQQLDNFFQFPDGENPWADWLRPILEDMMVIDAASILVDRTLSGKVAKLRWTDGADILKIVDDQGYLPEEGWAYTQLWEGIPRIALSRRDLVYRPSNIVPGNNISSKIYGSSITQQLAPEIRIGQERLRFVLAYYTEGSVPGLVHVVPPGVTVDKILEGMQWANSELSGNLAKRRQWRMIQGYNQEREDQIEQLKEPILADVFDDLHIRKICFGYGTSAQRLLKAMNRASAESSQDSAEKEGTMPRVMWLKSTMDHILTFQFDQPNYEWLPDTDDELDAAKQDLIDDAQVKSGRRTIDETREQRGLIPFGLPETSQPIIITATGVIPVEGSIERTQQAHTLAMNPPKPVIQAPNEPAPKDSKKKLAKASSVVIDPTRDTGAIRQAKDKFRIRLAFWFQHEGRKATEAAFAKANKFQKDDSPKHIDEIVDAIMAELDWSSLAEVAEPDLMAAAIEGAAIGISDLEITDQDVISAINTVARDYAQNRSAEMVGMKRVDGELVQNPNAQYAIDESTRDMLRTSIKEAFEAETPVSQLAQTIQSSRAFSPDRAKLIAENEVRQAQVRGNLASWVKGGVVEKFRWQLSGDHSCCDICDAFAAGGPYPLAKAEAMLDETHPLCACILIATKIKGIDLPDWNKGVVQ
jgi:hypothetical protein